MLLTSGIDTGIFYGDIHPGPVADRATIARYREIKPGCCPLKFVGRAGGPAYQLAIVTLWLMAGLNAHWHRWQVRRPESCGLVQRSQCRCFPVATADPVTGPDQWNHRLWSVNLYHLTVHQDQAPL